MADGTYNDENTKFVGSKWSPKVGAIWVLTILGRVGDPEVLPKKPSTLTSSGGRLPRALPAVRAVAHRIRPGRLLVVSPISLLLSVLDWSETEGLQARLVESRRSSTSELSYSSSFGAVVGIETQTSNPNQYPDTNTRECPTLETVAHFTYI